MTSGADPMAAGRDPAAPVLWITGLSGSGKSTLARSVVQSLRAEGWRPLLLDGDLVRDAFEPSQQAVDHRPALRAERSWRLARLAHLAAAQGVPVVVATISLLHAVQGWNRDRNARYGEILLQAELVALRRRKPALYGSADAPAPPDVVGLDIPAEYPLRPDLVLQQRFAQEDLPRHRDEVLGLWRHLLQAQEHRA